MSLNLDKFKELLADTYADKQQELEKREAAVAVREKKAEEIFTVTRKEHLIVSLLVGSTEYRTTVEILNSQPDSYFTIRLAELKTPGDEEPLQLFIPRDGEAFRFVLEFLTYGKLFNPPSPTMAAILEADIEYYKLPNFLEDVEAEVAAPKVAHVPQAAAVEKTCYISLHNAQLGGSGQYWQWRSTAHINEGSFQLSTQSYQNDTVTVTSGGLYEIIIRTGVVTAANTYMALYIDGADKARCYASSCGNYNQTTHIVEIMELKANQKLQVYQSFNSSALNGDPYNRFIVRRLF